MQVRKKKHVCWMKKQNRCVHIMSFRHQMRIWLNANSGVCSRNSNTWEGRVGMTFGGVLIYAGSSSMSQPALLSTYNPSEFWVHVPLFPAVQSLHPSEAKKWWVALNGNILVGLGLLFTACACTAIRLTGYLISNLWRKSGMHTHLFFQQSVTLKSLRHVWGCCEDFFKESTCGP